MSGLVGRRYFIKTAVISGAALAAGLGGRHLLAAGEVPEKINVAFFLETKPTMIAKGEGWFEKLAGAKINWTEASNGAEAITGIAAKSVDIGVAIGSSPTAAGIANNIPFQIVCLVDNIGPAEEMVVRKAANIKTPADFKGKKVATTFGSTSHFRLLGFLKTNGLTEKDVTVLDLKADAAVAAWLRGDIDASYYWSPFKAKMLEANGEYFPTSKKLDAQGYVIADVIIARNEFGKEYPDAVTGFLKAYGNALASFKSDPDAAAAIVAKQAGVTPAVARRDMDEYDFLTFERQLSDDWLGPPGKPGKFASVLRSTAEFLVTQKSIRTVPPLKTFQDGINTTFLSQAAKA